MDDPYPRWIFRGEHVSLRIVRDRVPLTWYASTFKRGEENDSAFPTKVGEEESRACRRGTHRLPAVKVQGTLRRKRCCQ